MAANSSLELSVVKGTACPGGDLEYTCTVSTTTTMVFSLRWMHLGSTILVIFQYDEPMTLTNQSIAGFSTTASIIPSDYTLTTRYFLFCPILFCRIEAISIDNL